MHLKKKGSGLLLFRADPYTLYRCLYLYCTRLGFVQLLFHIFVNLSPQAYLFETYFGAVALYVLQQQD